MDQVNDTELNSKAEESTTDSENMKTEIYSRFYLSKFVNFCILCSLNIISATISIYTTFPANSNLSSYTEISIEALLLILILSAVPSTILTGSNKERAVGKLNNGDFRKTYQIATSYLKTLVILLPTTTALVTIYIYKIEGKIIHNSFFEYINSTDFIETPLLISILYSILSAFFITIMPKIIHLLQEYSSHVPTPLNITSSATAHPISNKLAHYQLATSDTLVKEAVSDLASSRSAVIIDLRSRADHLKKVNFLILTFIVIVLFCAAGFIVFAGNITTSDTKSLNPIQPIQNSKENLEKKISDLNNKEMELKKQQTTLQLLETENPKKNNDPIADLTAIKTELSILEENHKRVSEELKKTSELLLKAQEAPLNRDPDKDVNATETTTILFAAGITRLGVLAISIYLVQILVNLYRHNAKIAGFYLGKADALMLLDHCPEKLSNISETLLPEIDFGKTPSSFPERVYKQLETMTGALSDKYRQTPPGDKPEKDKTQ